MPKLYEALVALPPDLREDAAARPCIVIRDRETKKLSSLSDYYKHPKVVKNLETLTRYNEFMQNVEIDFGFKQAVQHVFSDRNGKRCAIDPSNKHLYAVFHNDAAQQLTYGRLHGPFWQSLPSKLREELHINGQSTIELDYRAQSMNIVAGLSGVQLEGDPYQIDLSGTTVLPSEWRELVKLAVVVMLNTSSRSDAFAALRGKKGRLQKFQGVRFTNEFLDDLYSRMLTSHSFLEDWAFRGKGMSVFEEDAEIARRIVEISSEERIPVLPIHDGFIVQERHQVFLRNLMNAVWKNRFGTRIGIA
jgi:bifunctional DNA-binding transcriptional regulator/antitoxin component of YhaV-PrlF toxin-antitoxin module